MAYESDYSATPLRVNQSLGIDAAIQRTTLELFVLAEKAFQLGQFEQARRLFAAYKVLCGQEPNKSNS
ncbi:MAG: hypothetical protein K2W95_12885 [Candidatus Obscuribacterales bacterium]|nr:hypothetical protein [Candidatus Obscuribacterales bacterium]